ncbi:hypothetical protein GUJ93_ZPchr0014g47140 [Zizania palustris]|uniref:Uncharacterized protein n=1 Tax=Zizania palustris TaxID=103762 RepID=A0A8J5TBW6_ZIZPA|nr:hypothetical protein GUJ93_ZPchr0014g47140 [Zizania palustris]
MSCSSTTSSAARDPTAEGRRPQCVAQFAKDLLFREYSVSSRNGSRVAFAFAVDAALLHHGITQRARCPRPVAGRIPICRRFSVESVKLWNWS